MRIGLLMKLRQSGLTLVELMIALALSLVILLVATSMFLSTSSLYRSQDEIGALQQGGRFAVELLARLIRQTEYENWDKANGNIINSAAYFERSGSRLSPAIMGGNDVRPDADAPADFAQLKAGGINGSDLIRLQYFGASRPDDITKDDGSILDCGGNGIPGPIDIDEAENERAASVFYVEKDTQGEPNLYCAYRGKAGWATEPLVKGVESFQVLYGLDTGIQDSYPDRYVRADQITDDDMWRRVVAVKISLLIRSNRPVKVADFSEQFNLFGDQYPGTKDPGTIIKVASLPSSTQGRLRKVYSTTVFLRNQVIH